MEEFEILAKVTCIIVHRAAHCHLDAVLSIFKWPLVFAPGLNEELVQLLLIRDELHTEQDAMLVDIEDLTRSVSDTHPCQRRKEAQGGPKLKNWGKSDP